YKETMINFAPALSHVYFHPALHTYAVAGPPDRPWGVSSFDVSFITILADGKVITTINGLKDLLPPVPAWFQVYDHYLPGLEQQWEAHLQVLRRLPEEARPTIQLKPEEFL